MGTTRRAAFAAAVGALLAPRPARGAARRVCGQKCRGDGGCADGRCCGGRCAPPGTFCFRGDAYARCPRGERFGRDAEGFPTCDYGRGGEQRATVVRCEAGRCRRRREG